MLWKSFFYIYLLTKVYAGIYLQITTHSRLLSSSDLQDVAASTLLTLSNILCLSLQQFQTEQQFCLSVRLVM